MQHQRRISPLARCIELLMTPDGGDQQSGCRDILEYGDAAFEPLAAALQGEDRRGGGWEYVAKVLLLLNYERAMPFILGALRDGSNPKRQRDMASIFCELKYPEVVPDLIALLNSEDALYSSINALAHYGDKHAFEPVLRHLNHPDVNYVQPAILRTLAVLDGTRAFDIVLPFLQSEYRHLRGEAVRTLGSTGDPRAYPILIELLNSSDAPTQTDAVDALGSLGDERAVPLLIPFLNDDYAAYSAIVALRKIGGQAAVEVLVAFFQDVNHEMGLRLHAAGAVLVNGFASAHDLVFAYPDPKFVRNAIEFAILNGSADKLPVEQIIAFWTAILELDADPEARKSVLRLMQGLSRPRGVHDLGEVFYFRDKRIRQAAEDALNRLGIRDE